jgi:predicted KAP-like P-loop ATPase
MHDYFNDSPIETAEDDRYGITPLANSIAKSILSIKQPIGTTIALNGPWGSGKSSALNLIRTALQDASDDKLVVTDFKCWWYRGEDALALAFLQNLHTVLKASLGDKVKGLIPNMTQHLLQAGPVIGTAVSLATGSPWASLISPTSNFARTFFPDGETVEKTFRKLAEVLNSQDRRFLVIIDDCPSSEFLGQGAA